MRFRPWHIASVVLLVAFATLGVYAFWPAGVQEGTNQIHEPLLPIEAAEIEVIVVRPVDFALRASATGHLAPWREAAVSAEVGGRVTARLVDEGAYVGAGATLLRLDDRHYQLSLAESEAALLKAQAEFAAQLVGDPTDDDDRTAVRRATTGMSQAENAVERAKLNVQHTLVQAPFAGRVADVKAEFGQRVVAGETLLRILDASRMKVEVGVVSSDMVKMRVGASARVEVPSLNDALFEGVIHSINPVVGRTTGTGRVTVAVSNAGGELVAGLFAYVALETDRLPQRLVVPDVAMLVRQGRDLVFTVKGGRAQWTYVTVGARSGGQTEILEGLNAGDHVAVANHFALAHGAPVSVTVVDGSMLGASDGAR